MTDTPQPPEPTNDRRWRMRLALVLVVLFAITLIASNHAGWLARTVLNTETFVAALAPLPQDPEVSRALGEGVADSIMASNEVGKSIADTLPDGFAFIALPIMQSLRDLIADIATDIIRSDAFTVIWEKVLELTHRATMLYIRGAESDLLTTEGGYVVLDLTDIGSLVGDKLDALGVNVLEGIEPDLTIELFETSDGGFIRTLANLIYSIRWISISITIVLLISAYAVATDRRKLTVWMGSATAIAMLVSLIDGRLLRSLIAGGIEDPVQQAGVVAAQNVIFSGFVAQSWVLLSLGVLAAAAAWLMGDSRRATSIRATFTDTALSGTDQGASSFALFVTDYRRLLEAGAVIVVGAVLLFGPLLPPFGILAWVGALSLFVAAVEYVVSVTSRATDEGGRSTADG